MHYPAYGTEAYETKKGKSARTAENKSLNYETQELHVNIYKVGLLFRAMFKTSTSKTPKFIITFLWKSRFEVKLLVQPCIWCLPAHIHSQKNQFKV